MSFLKPVWSVASIEAKGMRHEVPYVSQYDESIPEEWRQRSCGIAALRMALGAALPGQPLPTVPELIEEGVRMGAYVEGVGWRHDGLVQLAQHYGAHAFRREYRFRAQRFVPPQIQDLFSYAQFLWGFAALHSAVSRGVVPIVSVTVPGKRDTHLVPLVGYGEEQGTTGFYYHEPAVEPGAADAQFRFLSLEEFYMRWRRLAIFVAKSPSENTSREGQSLARGREIVPPMQLVALARCACI